MFDLITGRASHAPRPQGVPLLVSVVVHTAVIGAVFVAGFLIVSEPVPKSATMMAFVAPAPLPPPPLPAPAPTPEPPTPKPKAETPSPVPPVSSPAPIEPPPAVEPVAGFSDLDEAEVFGVAGGVPGGIPGGVVGGAPAEPPLPPPAPPAPPPPMAAPIRVGGEVRPPALVERVPPVYPAAASAMGLEGRVILEAVVDEEGRVIDLKVLRSAGVFDKPALEAVRQWRYSPVLLNGRPVRFILTVVVSFTLER